MKSNQVPVVRPISWLGAIPQLIALALAIAGGRWVVGSTIGIAIGAFVFVVYSWSIRRLMTRDHIRGISLSLRQQYDEAILAHKASYRFFTRYPWIDRWRSLTLMSMSRMPYRELALVNIAFAYSQIGNGEKSKEYYHLALEQFPNSGMAAAALKMIDSFEQRSPAHANVDVPESHGS